MRKLKLQVQMTIDGFMAGPNGEMDWLCFDWSDDIKEYVTNLTKNVDTILLGKNLAQGFIPHWTASYNSEKPDDGAETFVLTPKVVFSKTLKTSEWERTSMANGDLKTEVMELKNHPWFIGVQYHPEYRSTVLHPHPLFVSFVKATLQFKVQLKH